MLYVLEYQHGVPPVVALTHLKARLQKQLSVFVRSVVIGIVLPQIDFDNGAFIRLGILQSPPDERVGGTGIAEGDRLRDDELTRSGIRNLPACRNR